RISGPRRSRGLAPGLGGQLRVQGHSAQYDPRTAHAGETSSRRQPRAIDPPAPRVSFHRPQPSAGRLMTADGLRISPTAQYTSYVWFRNGLSHAALASREGRFYYRAFWPLNRMWERL